MIGERIRDVVIIHSAIQNTSTNDNEYDRASVNLIGVIAGCCFSIRHS